MLEETGYTAPIDHFSLIGSCHPLPSLCSLRAKFVLVENVEKKQEPQLEPSENLHTILITEAQLEEILKAQATSEVIVDGLLTSGFLYYKLAKSSLQ